VEADRQVRLTTMKLIVGLGNPGREYRETRHNVGFMVVDEITRRYQLQWSMAPAQVPDAFVAKRFPPSPGLRGVSGESASGSVAVLLAKPLTFMNRSGDVVAALSRYYDIPPADLLVVVDEAALPFTRLRARPSGSAGGHNGIKSVIDRLGTMEFPRLRLGVGRGDARRDLADHVLSTFERGEQAELESLIARAADAAEMFAAEGISRVMNAYNPDAAAPDTTD
jgi:peptidyl-tRNA hydrolase, PTH1 family